MEIFVQYWDFLPHVPEILGFLEVKSGSIGDEHSPMLFS